MVTFVCRRRVSQIRGQGFCSSANRESNRVHISCVVAVGFSPQPFSSPPFFSLAQGIFTFVLDIEGESYSTLFSRIGKKNVRSPRTRKGEGEEEEEGDAKHFFIFLSSSSDLKISSPEKRPSQVEDVSGYPRRSLPLLFRRG